MFRWLALAVLLATMAVSGVHRHRARRASGTIPRRRESPGLIAGRLLVGLPLFGGVLAWIVHPPAMAWSLYPSPPWLRWAGVGLGVAVIPAVHWTLRSLGANVSETVLTKERHELVTGGPYRWLRHPLYTCGITLFTALGLMAASWFVLLMAALALAGVRGVVVPLEERRLAARFGAEYQAYRRRTGGMLPRLPWLGG